MALALPARPGGAARRAAGRGPRRARRAGRRRGPPAELATRDVLRGRALLALGRYADAVALLEAAAAAAEGALLAEAQLAWAEALLQADRLGEAEPILEALLATDPPGPPAARALALSASWSSGTAAGRSRPATCATRSPPWARCARARAAALLQSALLALAIADLGPAPRALGARRAARRRVDRAAPAAPARRLHEQLALGSLLLGELECAWAIASALREGAPAGVPAIAADLLAAQIACAAGETFTPLQLLARAVTEAEHVAWGETGAAGRRVLLGAGRARRDGRAARRDRALGHLRWAPRARPRRGGRPGRAHDPRRWRRWRAQRSPARAASATCKARRSHRDRAVAGAGRRAGRAARGAGAGRARPTTPPRSSVRPAHEPGSALLAAPPLRLARRARARARAAQPRRAAGDARDLPGPSPAEIAERFGRSKNTIRNQTRRLYQVMGVRTRTPGREVRLDGIAPERHRIIRRTRRPGPDRPRGISSPTIR